MDSAGKKKICVTGDNGVCGRELVNLLLAEGHEVLGLDKNNPVIERSGSYMRYQRNLAFDSIKDELESFQPEVIFHLAASFEKTKETPESFVHVFENDTLASHRLLNVIRGLMSVKTFVFASSYLIYDSRYYLWPKPNKWDQVCTTYGKVGQLPISETSPTNNNVDPRNLCGLSKLYTERELEHLCVSMRPDLRHVNARIFRVYGCGGKEIVSQWCRTKLRKERVQIFNKENRFDFIFAQDVAEGLKRLAFSEAKGIVNLGTGISRSIQEVSELIGVEAEAIPDDLEWEASCADINKLKQLTGWTPQIQIKDGIKEVLAYETSRLNHFSL